MGGGARVGGVGGTCRHSWAREAFPPEALRVVRAKKQMPGFCPAQSVVLWQVLCPSWAPGCLLQRHSISRCVCTSLLTAPCFCCPVPGPAASSPCSLLGPNLSSWSAFVHSKIAAQVDKCTLQDRRASQGKNHKTWSLGSS